MADEKEVEDDGLVEIRVVEPVTFYDDDHQMHHYKVGKHRVPQAHADNWFVKFHLEDPPPNPRPPVGSFAFAQEEAKAAQEQRLKAEDELARFSAEQQEKARREREEATNKNNRAITTAGQDALAREKAKTKEAKAAVKEAKVEHKRVKLAE